MRVLVVDGPYKGKVLDVVSMTFQAVQNSPLSGTNYFDFHLSDDQSRLVNLDVVTYRVHRLRFLDEIIAVASIAQTEPSHAVVKRAILTRKAQQAIMK